MHDKFTQQYSVTIKFLYPLSFLRPNLAESTCAALKFIGNNKRNSFHRKCERQRGREREREGGRERGGGRWRKTEKEKERERERERDGEGDRLTSYGLITG